MLVREGMSLTQRQVSHLCDLCVENKRSVSGASDESEFPKILCVPLPLCGSALIIRGRVLSLSRREGRATETRRFSKHSVPPTLRLLRVLRRRHWCGVVFNAERPDRAARGSIHGDKGHFIGKARRRRGRGGFK